MGDSDKGTLSTKFVAFWAHAGRAAILSSDNRVPIVSGSWHLRGLQICKKTSYVRAVSCGRSRSRGAIATPLLFLLIGGPAQVTVAFSTYSLFFIFVAFGLIAILACAGAYRSLNNEATKPLLLFAFSAIVAVNFIALPLTNNSYRFLVYLWLPVALFASYYISTVVAGLTAARFSSAKMSLKVLAIVAAVLLALPTSYLLWDFYNEGSYVLASPAEVQALQWIKGNTPKDAIFLEAPSTFPRIPIETRTKGGFRCSIYTIQYHGVDLQTEIDALMNERSPRIPESQPSAAQRVVRFCRFARTTV